MDMSLSPSMATLNKFAALSDPHLKSKQNTFMTLK